MLEPPIIDVWDEPYHGALFQDDSVQVLRVRVPPGATSQFHRHVVDGIAFSVVDASFDDQRLGEEWIARTTTAGRITTARPRVHRIRNSGATEVHIVDVEVPIAASDADVPPLNDPALELAIETPGARAYRLTLPATASTLMISSSTPCLLVAITDGVLRIAGSSSHRFVAWIAGTVQWENAPTAIQITNISERPFVGGILLLR